MLTICYAAKGGTGTTVVVATIGLSAPGPTLLVDLAGDLPAVLGTADPDGPGVLDWLRSDAAPERLRVLERTVTADVTVLHRGADGGVPPERWQQLAAWLATDARTVVVDAGTGMPPAALTSAGRTLLATRCCYLALRAATRMAVQPDGVVLIREPGRSLGAPDVAAAIGAPVVATMLLDPAIARSVDAGLLAARIPSAARRTLRSVA
jgi:hypothetical protein